MLSMLLLPMLAGCSFTEMMPRMAAGYVGCVPDDIEVREIDSGIGGAVWLATCEGVTFVCSTGGSMECTPLLRDQLAGAEHDPHAN